MKRLKNFFKKNLKFIIICIALMIITSMVSVYAAYNYLSTDVSYTKADGTTVSVADALNELYKSKTSLYYADVNDDGTVDGVIFIDLAKGAYGTLGAEYSYYVKQSGLKKYQLSAKKSSYTDSHFGKHEVITPVSGSTGADRFYVMALSDYSTSTYTWANACKLTKTVGSVTFRLPSKTEWAAFSGQLGITTSNYLSTYGLRAVYWTSTEGHSNYAWGESDSNYAWCASFSLGRFDNDTKTGTDWARLCATF